MAHKGKIYPYFFARDLSLKPGGYTYLPDRWLWSGILATGTDASKFVGKTFELICTQGVDVYYGNIYWNSRINLPGGHWSGMGLHYGLSFKPNMSVMDFTAYADNDLVGLTALRDTTSSFPYNQAPTLWQHYYPARLTIQYPGILIPKPW